MSDLKNGITVLGSNYFEVINEITIIAMIKLDLYSICFIIILTY